MADVLAAVQATYILVDSKYTTLREVCTTDQQRNDLATQNSAAQNAWCACENKTLHDDDPAVAALHTKLQAANAIVERSTAQLESIGDVINHIADAVSTCEELVKKLP